MFQCVAVCCSMLHCVAVYDYSPSAPPSTIVQVDSTVPTNYFPFPLARFVFSHHTCVAACCSMLQCAVLQCALPYQTLFLVFFCIKHTCTHRHRTYPRTWWAQKMQHITVHCVDGDLRAGGEGRHTITHSSWIHRSPEVSRFRQKWAFDLMRASWTRKRYWIPTENCNFGRLHNQYCPEVSRFLQKWARCWVYCVFWL